jgi:transposase
MATKHPLDGSEPPVNIGGRPPALKPEHIAVLHDIVTERAQASLQEIADELYRRCGVRVCEATIRRTLPAQSIVRLKPKRRAYRGRRKRPSAMVTRRRIGAKTFLPTVLI